MGNRRIACIVTTLSTLALALALAAPALGVPNVVEPQWEPAGSGMTHTNAMKTAMSMAAGRGSTWVQSIAIDRSVYPDTVFRDNVDHNANWWGSYPSYYNKSWGNRFGNPQGKVQSNYNSVVAALRRGDAESASIYMGYLSHYLIDINGPMHTQESATEDSALHHNLEADAMTASFSSYIHDDGYQRYGGHSSPSALVVANANSSHAYYSDLINSYGSGHHWTSHVHDIEGVNFNRGVNSIADLIQSAQDDAESVGAAIDSDVPTATVGQPVTFSGRGGSTLNLAIVAYSWRSSADGVLSTSASFTTSSLSIGAHNIYFKAQSASGKWSAEAMTTIVIGAPDTNPLPVYRFLNRKTSLHFYTISETEKRNVLATLGSTYSLEGVAYALDASATANADPLFRFYNKVLNSHFYTASPTERDNIIATLGSTYTYEGVAFNVDLSPTDSLPVWRFYNLRKGAHFYTANDSERNTVATTMTSTYRYEGIAWYYVPPWPIP